MKNHSPSELGAWTLFGERKEKKRALQRKFEEPCASEGLLALPLSCM